MTDIEQRAFDALAEERDALKIDNAHLHRKLSAAAGRYAALLGEMDEPMTAGLR